jgi:formate-dependent nitrite reductase membrane component NrfD
MLGLITVALNVWPFGGLGIDRSLRLGIAVAAGLFAAGTAMYTGFLLSSMKSVSFWHSPLLEVLFFLSALVTGSACIVVTAVLVLGPAADPSIVRALVNFIVVVVVLKSFILAFFLVTMYGADDASRDSVLILVNGDLKLLFWGGVTFGGLILPPVLSLLALSSPHPAVMKTLLLLTCTLILVGGLLLRYMVLAAGVRVTALLPGCR